MLSIKQSLAIIACVVPLSACIIPTTVHDTPEIHGVILDSRSAAPVANAHIRVIPIARPDLARTVVADSTGRFRVDAISHTALQPPLPHAPWYGYASARLEIRAPGYDAASQDLHTLREGTNAQGDIVIAIRREQALALN